MAASPSYASWRYVAGDVVSLLVPFDLPCFNRARICAGVAGPYYVNLMSFTHRSSYLLCPVSSPSVVSVLNRGAWLQA